MPANSDGQVSSSVAARLRNLTYAGSPPASKTEMARILSISYDPVLLRTRELLLQQMGHDVTSAEGFAEASRLCGEADGTFDLIVMGHSIPHEDKRMMIRQCRLTCTCPVLALLRSNEPPVEEATRSVDSAEPRAFVTAIGELLDRNGSGHKLAKGCTD